MRKLAFVLLPALMAACASPGDEKPKKRYEPSPEATAHFEKGRALFAAAESAPVPSEALAAALAELREADRGVDSPEHRFALARVSLLLDPSDKSPRELAESCVEEVPEDARFLALAALAHASLEEAARALDVAQSASLSRSDRCLVGDLVMLAVAATAPRTLSQADERGRLTLRAADLGSPYALVFSARLHWLARKPPIMDWPKAREQAEAAAKTTFTPEERGRSLLFGTETAARMGARDLGHMLVEEGDFAKAAPWLRQGLGVEADLLDKQAVVALADLGAIEAFALDGDATHKERGLAALELAGQLGFTPALVRRAWLDKEKRDALLAEARRRGSPGGYAGAGDWDALLELLESQREEAKTDLQKLPRQRLVFFLRALRKGGAVRVETEKAAREAVERDREDSSVPLVRQFRHIAGDISADDLQRTMPRSAHVPRWRAETELALATRCLILADRDGAKEHLQRLLDAGALFTEDDEIAWGALRELERK
jgi:hypothetical protein